MGQPLRLTPDLADRICEYARQGMPLARSSVLCGVHRVTALRWLTQGAAEIAERDETGDEGELPIRAQFAIDFENARAGYLLGLATKWEKFISEGDYNSAKAVQTMMSSQSPDEFSERRVTKTIDQKVAMSAELSVNRFAAMTAEELGEERAKIEARRSATEIEGDDDWRQAAVRGGEVVRLNPPVSASSDDEDHEVQLP